MFQIGDRIMYAGHGACEILGTELKTVDKRKVEYYVLEPVEQPGTRYFIPTQNSVAVAKMQHMLTKSEFDQLLQSVGKMEMAWIDDENQRRQKYRELLTGGDRGKLICMMGHAYNHRTQQLAAGRKFHLCDENFLRDAERLLHSELCLVLDMNATDVGTYIREKISVE